MSGHCEGSGLGLSKLLASIESELSLSYVLTVFLSKFCQE